jgi:hypothetical protein
MIVDGKGVTVSMWVISLALPNSMGTHLPINLAKVGLGTV